MMPLTLRLGSSLAQRHPDLAPVAGTRRGQPRRAAATGPHPDPPRLRVAAPTRAAPKGRCDLFGIDRQWVDFALQRGQPRRAAATALRSFVLPKLMPAPTRAAPKGRCDP